MKRQRKLSKRDRPTGTEVQGGTGGLGGESFCEESEDERLAGKREGLSEVEEELLWFRCLSSSRSGKF